MRKGGEKGSQAATPNQEKRGLLEEHTDLSGRAAPPPNALSLVILVEPVSINIDEVGLEVVGVSARHLSEPRQSGGGRLA